MIAEQLLRRLLNEARLRRWKSSLSPDCYLDPSVQVVGARNVRIGPGSQIGEQTWINVNYSEHDEARISLGRKSMVGRRNIISSAAKIEIGDYFMSASDCIVIGSNHVYEDPTRPYASTGNEKDGVITIGPNCWMGGYSAIIGAVSVGRGSIIGAHSNVLTSVPPFSIVGGNPGRILRRYSFVQKRWVKSEEFSEEDVAAMPDDKTYLAMLDEAGAELVLPRRASGTIQGGRP